MTAARLLALAVLAAPAVAAQTPDRAEIALGGVLPSQPFGGPWSVEPGVGARLAVPLHGGTAEARLAFLRYNGGAAPDRSVEVPDFALITATVGWGPTVRLGPAEVTPVARVGAVQFRFDPEDDQGRTQLSDEAEAAVGVALRVAVPVGRLALWAEGEALRIALRDPEAVASLSGGLALRFGVPPAVRRVLDE